MHPHLSGLALAQANEKSSGHSSSPLQQVIPDGFSDIWVSYADGSWRWIDLTALIVHQRYASLQDPEVFKQVSLSTSGSAVNWPAGVTLTAERLDQTLGKLSNGVLVRACGITGLGWYRPLQLITPGQVNRKRVKQWGLWAGDKAGLQYILGWERKALLDLLAVYPAEARLVASRLMDLILYLVEPSTTELFPVERLRQKLFGSWALANGEISQTPIETIQQGNLRSVEQIYVHPSLSLQWNIGRS